MTHPHRFTQGKILAGIRTASRPKSLASNLLMGGAVFALSGSLATSVFAQEALEEILVTGSRISRTTMDTPTPVSTIQAGELSAMAPGNLIEGLSQLPVFYGNQTQEQVNGGQNSGGSNVNMRGAGNNRTLTLLNGRRVVPSNRFGAVDVNVFPEDLLRTVESVTGGASASYGTDAVAGVVNFLLDTDYVGLKTHAQTGMTEYGDGRTWETGAAFGHDFGNGLHVLGSFSAYDQAKISSFGALQDRDYLMQRARITNPDANGPTDIIRAYVSPTNFTNTGVMIDTTRPALNRMVFQPDGSVKAMTFSGIGAMNTGCLCQAEPTQTYGVNGDDEINNSFRRYNGFLYADYDVTENLTLFGQAIWADNSASDQRESIPLLSAWQGRIYADNAFLQPAVSQLITASTPAASQFVGYGVFLPNTPDTVLGESRQDTNNEMYSLTGGFNGEVSADGFFNGWDYNGYYQYGKNVQDFVCDNCVRVDRLQFAMDAVRNPVSGQPICRVNLPQFTVPVSNGGNGGLFSNCAPINTFGGVQNISKAAAAYVMDRDGKIARQWTTQRVMEFVMNGDVWDGIGAGAWGMAFGASYRKEILDQLTIDPSDEFPAQIDGTLLSNQGIAPAGLRGVVPQGNTSVKGYTGIPGLRFVPAGFLGDANSSSVLFSSLRAIEGGFTVKELFTELNMPLIEGAQLADSVEANVSARWADYSGSGEIWAWKFGLNWTINDEWRVRATQSRDVRAASLRERFDQTRGGINVTNPWDNSNLVAAASLSGGNPNVTPEEADTITAGVVFQPSFLDGFSVSLDWYSIDIAGALAQLTAQNIVNSCRRGDLSLCQYVISGNGSVTDPLANTFRPIDRVESIFINLQNQTIEGMDLEATYVRDVDFMQAGGAESLAFRVLASNLAENSIQTPGGVVDDRAGQIGGFGFADYKVNFNVTYSNGPYSAFLQARWIDGGLLDRTYLESSTAVLAAARPAGSILALCSTGARVCTIDDNSVPSMTYVDLRVAGRFGSEENLEVYGNINNMLDRNPNVTPGAIGRTGVGLGVNSSLYDILGRRYTVGVNYEF